MRDEDLMPAVVRTVQTLQQFSAERPMITHTGLAEALGVNRRTAGRLLQSLAVAGMVRQVVLGPHARFFAPTAHLLSLGAGYLRSAAVWDLIAADLREVAQATEACACLVVLDGGEVVCVGAATPPTSGLVRVHLHPGAHLPVTTAPGWVLLAGLSAAGLDAWLRRYAADWDAAAVREQAEQVRIQGYADVTGEAWSLAVPVTEEGQVVAALGLVGHQSPLDEATREQHQVTLVKAAGELGGLLPPTWKPTASPPSLGV